MKKIFDQYGGVITTAMAIVALISVIGLFFTPGGTGWMDNAFKDVIEGFGDKVENVSTQKPLKQVYSGTDGNYTAGYYISLAGEEVEHAGMAYTNTIDVDAGATYYFSYFSAYSYFPVVAMYDNNKTFVASYEPAALQSLENSYCAIDGEALRTNNYEQECGWITIPEGVSTVVFNIPKSQVTNFEIYKGSWKSPLHSYTSVLPASNNLTGRSALFVGDSITSGDLTGNEAFPNYIAEANSMKYSKWAVGGYSLKHMVSSFNESYKQPHLLALTANDYVIVGGFINDVIGSNNPLPIGSLSAEGTTELDTTTFTGQLEKFIYDYQQAGYKAKLGFVLTSKPGQEKVQSNSYGSVRDYWDAAIAVFEKYDVEYLDLYDKTYSLVDGLHPDYQGAYDMAEDIEVWMNSF